MTGNDGRESGYTWVEIELVHVMENIDVDFTDRNSFGFWQSFCPATLVAVPPDGNHWCDPSQFFQKPGIPYIARVDNEFRTFELGDRFGSQQPVSIRYDTNNMIILCSGCHACPFPGMP